MSFSKHTRFLGQQERATRVHLRLSEFLLAIKKSFIDGTKLTCFSLVSYIMYKAFLPVHPIHDISGTALLSQLKYCSTVLVFSCADLD